MADRSELPVGMRGDEQIVWSDRFEAWGTYAQGDAIFVTIDRATGPRVCDYYRRQMTDAAIGVSTHPKCVDGLRARELAAENARLRASLDALRGDLERTRDERDRRDASLLDARGELREAQTEVARLQALLAASPLRVAPSEHDGSAA